MKQIFGYIVGILSILAVFGMICVVSVIYDTNDKITVEPYFFRTGLTAINQTDIPQTASQIGQSRLRDWLIQKFVKEYFYVVPDPANIALRTSKEYPVLKYMSAASVFKEWEKGEFLNIRELAAGGVMRTVRVFNEIFKPEGSDYWRVDYELKTWYNPNDMNEEPTITRGTMYLRLYNEDAIGQIKEPFGDVQKLLIDGVDPAFALRFMVIDVLFDKE